MVLVKPKVNRPFRVEESGATVLMLTGKAPLMISVDVLLLLLLSLLTGKIALLLLLAGIVVLLMLLLKIVLLLLDGVVVVLLLLVGKIVLLLLLAWSNGLANCRGRRREELSAVVLEDMRATKLTSCKRGKVLLGRDGTWCSKRRRVGRVHVVGIRVV
jgi:hypothetical protein